jgi:hypothetical protein
MGNRWTECLTVTDTLQQSTFVVIFKTYVYSCDLLWLQIFIQKAHFHTDNY